MNKWLEEMLLKEDLRMYNKYMKSCSGSLAIREMQLKHKEVAFYTQLKG